MIDIPFYVVLCLVKVLLTNKRLGQILGVDVRLSQPPSGIRRVPIYSSNMADDENPHVTKHRRHHHVKDKGSERDSKKRHRQDRDEDTHSHKSKRPREKGKTSTKSKSKMTIIDDDPDEDLWVEKNIDMDGENVCSCLSFTLLSRERCGPPTPVHIPGTEALVIVASPQCLPSLA